MNAHYYPDIMIMIVTIFVIWNVPCQPDYVTYVNSEIQTNLLGEKMFFQQKIPANKVSYFNHIKMYFASSLFERENESS